MIAYRLDVNEGQLIDGKYRIQKHIGSGSYGDVYKVIDALGVAYALKLLRLWEVGSDLHDGLIEKFEQEYKTARIQSEYLVHSLDSGVVRGNPYIVMEFCPAGDLSKMIGKDTSQLPRYAHDILKGLYVLHSEGKLHRDMKPENVLFRPNGRAALTDFGIVGEMDKSKRMSEVGWLKHRPKQAMGTPLYMSPEMASREGGGVTYLPTVDIWSFGVMMYEVLTGGSFPFGNISQIEDLPMYQKRMRKGLWDVALLRRSVTDPLWVDVIEQCLEPDYRKRYQSAPGVLQDIKPLLGRAYYSMPPINERQTRSRNISRIIITQGRNVGQVFDLNRLLPPQARMIRVGREQDNNIVLSDIDAMYVSRYHFTLERSADGQFWTLRDGQWLRNERHWGRSTNGTYLNATPVPSTGLKLFTGDIITAGEFKLKLE